MLDELTVPLLGTFETDPDAIPRGFIHRDPDILNIHQQNTLSEMKVKMMDFNNEYLAKHPQVEALVRLLIKELIIHKPFYVRQFIKKILSSEDLETKVAKIVAAKGLSTERRHTRHYFSHVKTWQNKAAKMGEPEAQKVEGYWPEPRPFRTETRRDKREYCHPHYFRVPYVFFPTEYLKPKEPVLTRRKFPEFQSESYAKLVLQNYKDFWGDPITDIPPPFNDEELYTAYSVLKKKSPEEMTNEDLVKCCMRCRRTRLRNYLYAVIKKQFNDPLKKYPSYTIVQNSFKLRVANKFLEKTLEAIKNKDYKAISCAYVPADRPISDVDRELMRFETLFYPHHSIADIEQFESPVPGISFREEGPFSMVLPLGDLKKDIDGKKKLESKIKIEDFDDQRGLRIVVPTTDLLGNLVSESEINLKTEVKEISPLTRYSSHFTTEDRQIVGTVFDEKQMILAKTEVRRKPESQTTIKSIVKSTRGSSIERASVVTKDSKKTVIIRESGASFITAGTQDSSLNDDSQILPEENLSELLDSIADEENEKASLQDTKSQDSEYPIPTIAEKPYMQLLMKPRRLADYFKEEQVRERKCRIRKAHRMHHLKHYF